MTLSRWWWVRKKRKQMSSRMSSIEMNLNMFNYREQQSFGFSRNGTRDMACHRLYKLNDKKEAKITMGPSQACFGRILESIQEENLILERFIRRYS